MTEERKPRENSSRKEDTRPDDTWTPDSTGRLCI